jgi:gamma-glutamylaminecyclotransferase
VERRVRVFVYGTLMKGHVNHRVLVELEARPLGEARTIAPRTLVDLGPYPALLPADEARDAVRPAVTGELFEVAEAALEVLDVFEGCPDLYRRERIALEGAEGAEAWTYVLARPIPRHAVVLGEGRYVGGGVALERNAREREEEVLDKVR